MEKTNDPITAIYARVSTQGQKITGQVNELKSFCDRKGWINPILFKEKRSAAKGAKPEFDRLMKECQSGKVARVVVFDLSRLSRKGVADTIETINALQKMKVDLVSSNDGLDFHGQMGLVMASMLSAFSKIEHDLRAERQRIGIESAKKANGGKCPWGGSQRKRDASHDQSIQKLRETGLTIRKIAETLKLSPTTVQKSVKAHKSL